MQLLVFLLVILCSCSGGDPCVDTEASRRWMEPNGKVKVLCTIAMISDLVERVGGEDVDVLTLISAGLDPHSYQLVKGDDEKLLAADLVFFNGLGLEHGPSLRQHLTENPRSVSFGDHLLEEPGRIHYVDGLPDPHIWMDVSLWVEGIDAIVESLSEKLPDRASLYSERGQELREELLAAHLQIRALMQELPDEKRYLVTSHDAFHYFARAYLATEEEQEEGTWQERCAAPEGLAPESMLSVGDIQQIIDHLQKYDVRVIFSESNINQDSIRKIVDAATERGMEIRIADCSLFSDAMGCPGSEVDTYREMVEHNARCIVEQLQSQGAVW